MQRIWHVAAVAGVLASVLMIAPGRAQVAGQPLPPAQAPYAVQHEGHLVVRANSTATLVATRRVKILAQSAIQQLGQQQFSYIDGMETLEVVEAFTEKAGGEKVAVDPVNILSRDGASGLQAIYLRDLKQRTIIFSDIGVGDTLVVTLKKETLQGIFPGHFTQAFAFPRSQGATSIAMTVETPVNFDVQVKARGPGTAHASEVSGQVRRHHITIEPEPYAPEESGAVSPIDRDPIISVSTFKTYEEVGSVYASTALPKVVVTPEITKLADEITSGIEAKRGQAIAIDAWVKKNIRYVAVYLGQGRVVPNDPAAVLKNRFGDCKDKTTLMSALLAAKDIASEPVLVNLGTAYTLPEPPSLAALNHVILYLPEFNAYSDPTANTAAFGVLAAPTYDKPALRITRTGVSRVRLPPTKAADHMTTAATTMTIAADGTISGLTKQTAVGSWAASLRTAALTVQNLGNEIAAQRQLQAFNAPGSGRFDLGNSADLSDPITIPGSFKLNEPFKQPAAGMRAIIPYGLPILVRPSFSVLGERMAGRRSAFVCFAAGQIEDIDVTFDEGLPLPVPIRPLTIENPVFSYRSTYKLEGRTYKIHREFISNVAGQSCAPDIERQITADMATVRIDMNTTFTFK